MWWPFRRNNETEFDKQAIALAKDIRSRGRLKKPEDVKPLSDPHFIMRPGQIIMFEETVTTDLQGDYIPMRWAKRYPCENK